MKTIMLGTDFSERSDRALRRATLLARHSNAALLIVHAIDDDQPARVVKNDQDLASELLDDLCRTVRAVDGVACKGRVLLADPFIGIAQAAEQEAPDLLVLGPHRRQALRDIFVGTTAERAIRSVTCPVLMVNAPPVGPYKHVMLTSDFSGGARRAVNVSATLEIARGADVSILHVFDAPAVHLTMSHTMSKTARDEYIESLRDKASQDLDDFVRSTSWRSIRQNLRCCVESSPAAEILSLAKEEAADLIVVGTSGLNHIARFVIGSVAQEVLREADRDVLAVPPFSGAQDHDLDNLHDNVVNLT